MITDSVEVSIKDLEETIIKWGHLKPPIDTEVNHELSEVVPSEEGRNSSRCEMWVRIQF